VVRVDPPLLRNVNQGSSQARLRSRLSDRGLGQHHGAAARRGTAADRRSQRSRPGSFGDRSV